MTIRPGGARRRRPQIDRGLLKASKLGSDAKLLDCEFTVVEGPHARRKFWQTFTVAGGKVDEKGAVERLEHLQEHVPRDDRQRARARPRGR